MDFWIVGLDLFNWFNQAKKQGLTSGVDLGELKLLVTELTELDSLSLRLENYKCKEKIFSKLSLAEINKLWQLRIKKRIPIQYLLGECHWRNFVLKVTPDVLIPRPETELIIDLALELTANFPDLRLGNWLDLGTGSGAIALGLAEIFPSAEIHAVDISQNALKIAQENAFIQKLHHRIKFYHGSWFEPINELKNSFSGIISNPPYIPSNLVLELQPEVVNHEPKIALDGGDDGLRDIKLLINQAPNFLKKGGFLLIEIMAGQGNPVKELLEQNGNYSNIKIARDLANLERCAIAQFFPK